MRVGDVVITVDIDPGRFAIHGADIHSNVFIQMSQAMLGDPVDVLLPDGSTKSCVVALTPKMNIGCCQQSFPGLGLENKAGQRGQFVVHFHVEAPLTYDRQLMRASLAPRSQESDWALLDVLLERLIPPDRVRLVNNVLKRKRQSGQDQDRVGGKKPKYLLP
jgi:DnaJ-class molecular chaperone